MTGTPGICWEVKARGRPVSDGQVTAWLAETELERVNARADVGVLVVRRPGANVRAWWAVMALPDLHTLIAMPSEYEHPRFPVRLLLADAVTLLRAAGYGDPIPAEEVTAP